MGCYGFCSEAQSNIYLENLKDRDIRELLDEVNNGSGTWYVVEYPAIPDRRSFYEKLKDRILGFRYRTESVFVLNCRIDSIEVREIMLCSLFDNPTKKDVINYLNGYLTGRNFRWINKGDENGHIRLLGKND